MMSVTTRVTVYTQPTQTNLAQEIEALKRSVAAQIVKRNWERGSQETARWLEPRQPARAQCPIGFNILAALPRSNC